MENKPPFYAHGTVDDYPFEPDEYRLFGHIARWSGFDGEWCRRSALQMAESCHLSVRRIQEILPFLVDCRTITRRGKPGGIIEYQAQRPSEWADPAQVPAIRAERERITGQPKLRRIASAEKEEAKKYGNQPSLTGEALIAGFAPSQSSMEWAAAEYPQLSLDALTASFLIRCQENLKKGWKVEEIDLQGEWRRFVVAQAMKRNKAVQKPAVVKPKPAGPVEIDDPMQHPAVKLANEKLKGHGFLNIHAATEVAAQVGDLVMWGKVLDMWLTDYHDEGRKIRISRILPIYHEWVADPSLATVGGKIQPIKGRKVADVGTSQPNIEFDAEHTLEDLVAQFGMDSLKYEWMIDGYGYDAVVAELERQGHKVDKERKHA